jgi:hypothetical protein
MGLNQNARVASFPFEAALKNHIFNILFNNIPTEKKTHSFFEAVQPEQD